MTRDNVVKVVGFIRFDKFCKRRKIRIDNRNNVLVSVTDIIACIENFINAIVDAYAACGCPGE